MARDSYDVRLGGMPEMPVAPSGPHVAPAVRLDHARQIPYFHGIQYYSEMRVGPREVVGDFEFSNVLARERFWPFEMTLQI